MRYRSGRRRYYRGLKRVRYSFVRKYLEKDAEDVLINSFKVKNAGVPPFQMRKFTMFVNPFWVNVTGITSSFQYGHIMSFQVNALTNDQRTNFTALTGASMVWPTYAPTYDRLPTGMQAAACLYQNYSVVATKVRWRVSYPYANHPAAYAPPAWDCYFWATINNDVVGSITADDAVNYLSARQNHLKLAFLPQPTHTAAVTAWRSSDAHHTRWNEMYVPMSQWLDSPGSTTTNADMQTINTGTLDGLTSPLQPVYLTFNYSTNDGQRRDPNIGTAFVFEMYVDYYVLCYEYNTDLFT